jgi:predicted PurR-regulated permease PerM
MNEYKIGYSFVVLASVFIVLAGIKIASAIIVPFLLSLFIAIILSPFYNFIKSKNVPDSLSVFIVISVFVFLLSLVAKLIGTSIADFSSNINMYTEKLTYFFNSSFLYTKDLGLEFTVDDFAGLADSKKIMTFGTSILQGMSSLFTNGFVIVLTVVFMLIESQHFEDKIRFADSSKVKIVSIKEIASKIQNYMVLKALISLLTGFIVWMALLFIGTDYAFLWGVIAFLFNFIPNIGSIIAAVPAVFITLVQLGGMSAFFVALTYAAINIIVGSILEPRVMGKGLGLSTLIVFLSLIFWGWLLGIVGMLLSIPLTIMVKIVLDSNENTKWISVLLGSGEGINAAKK